MSGKNVRLICIGLLVAIIDSCTKDKVPAIPTSEPSKWELISGHYKVYDTMGIYIYDMDIVHVPNNEMQTIDSLRFENFDNEFNFTTKQEIFGNLPMHVTIGFHDTLFDSQGNRWKLTATAWEDYNNFKNDTIFFRFNKTNINYYIEDLVPYYSCDCRQVAIRQY